MSPRAWPTLLPGFEGTTVPPWLADRLRDGLGGVCLFARNLESREQLRALTAEIYAANPRALVALDEEGGDVTRLFADVGSPWPGNAVLGRLDDTGRTRAVAESVGWALRLVGVNVTFAPTVDVNTCADNPVIGVRSFGTDPERVAAHGVAWTRGVQATGVAASAKHFPGHGDTRQDSHVALPVVDRSPSELRARELVPFAAAVRAGVTVVMTSHIVLPQVDPDSPATMSRAVLTGLLRDELGFGGVIVSDALDMAGAASAGGMPETAARALTAGCDLLCLGNNTSEAELDAVEKAVREEVDPARLVQAGARVRALADDLLARRPPVPEPAGDWWDDLSTVVAAFDVQPRARRWRAERSAPDQCTPGQYTVVRLEPRPNIAVGAVPWDPFAARPEVLLTPTSDALPRADRDEPVLVVGRDIHRHRFAREAVDRLRAEHDQVLVVDMGWPGEDRRYADVATFGASRVVGRALLAWLGPGRDA